ncbi:MAG: hypothetical protein ACOYLO_04215 [Ferruginibacter sp.]
MKSVSTTIAIRKKIWQLIIIAGLLTMLHIPGTMYAQTDSTKTEAPAVEEESSMISPSLEFFTVQKSNNTIDFKAALKAKVKGTFYNLPLIKITFVQVTEAGDKELGFVITDRAGKAVFNVKSDSLITDKEGKLNFKAVYAGNKQMDAAEEEVIIKKARLEITPVKEDSLLSVTIKLIDVGTGTEVPVPETAIGVFIHRSFNPLKIGEGTTDEAGEASVEVPNNLPGDAKGNITLLAKLDENEIYGNLEASVEQKWGTVVSDKIEDQPRALWSSHPPIWMLVTFILLMAAVWGHYVVIVYQLLRLRKEEPHPVTDN